MRSQFKKLRASHPDYWNLPVPAWGDTSCSLLIIGLAPGMHGANKTGIPFTGDASGELLFKTLTALNIEKKVWITNAVKCLPIVNNPNSNEVNRCQKFLRPELRLHAANKRATILLLGQLAHRAVIKALGGKQQDYLFGHAKIHHFDDKLTLIDSYHCSRYNTQTGRLTEKMFLAAVGLAARSAGYSI